MSQSKSQTITCSDRELIRAAREAAEKSYSPYSDFKVGAALKCADGSIYCGTNVENRSYGLTICAERSAIFAAISAGKRRFDSIAIYSPNSEHPLPPCGACRQVLSEFSGAHFRLILCGSEGGKDSAPPRKESQSSRDRPQPLPPVAIKSMAELLPFDSLHELRE